MSFPWSDPNSQNLCGCRIPTRKKSQSIFKKITGAVGQWIADLLGTTSGQVVVRNDDQLGYLKPNCEGFLKLDTDGNATVETPSIMEGAASGNPLGYGYVSFLELFDKEICNPNGDPPTTEQWMRIKALMPQWTANGEIAVMNVEKCGDEKVRFDFLQPCPLPANGCPPDGLGYLASQLCDVPDNTGCVNKVRRWYWVTGLSIPDGDLIKNDAGVVDIANPDLWQLPVLKKRGGCWFFETVNRADVVPDGLMTYRVDKTLLYSDSGGPRNNTVPAAIPEYATYLDKARDGSKLWGLFRGYNQIAVGPAAGGYHEIFLNGDQVSKAEASADGSSSDTFGEVGIELTGPTVSIRDFLFKTSGAVVTGGTDVYFVGFQLSPK